MVNDISNYYIREPEPLFKVVYQLVTMTEVIELTTMDTPTSSPLSTRTSSATPVAHTVTVGKVFSLPEFPIIGK